MSTKECSRHHGTLLLSAPEYFLVPTNTHERLCFDNNVELFVKMLRQCAQLFDFEAFSLSAVPVIASDFYQVSIFSK